jgi:hypothetical protein
MAVRHSVFGSAHAGDALDRDPAPMKAPLPKRLISIPEDCDPRSRSTSGGRGDCPHHYVQNGHREWVCLNCDRICRFDKWNTKGGSV